MLGILYAVAIVAVIFSSLFAVIWLAVWLHGPAGRVLQEARYAYVAKLESVDLDRQYEELLRR